MKIFLQNAMFQIGVKNLVPRTYVVSDLKNEDIFGTFYEKELQKENQSLELKK